MRPHFKPAVLSLLLASALAAQAQTTPAKPSNLPDALVQVMRTAVSSNPEVQAKWNGFLAAGSQADIARAGFLPQLDLSASAGSENRSTPTIPNRSLDTTSAQLSVNQILFDGFFTASEVRRLGAARQTRYYELMEAAETAALEALRAYADVARYRELVDLATQNYVEHKQATNLVEERANSGVGKRVDVEQASGRTALAESNLLTELTNLHAASARYLRVIGAKPAANLPALPEPFRVGTLPASADVLLKEGIASSPTLLAALQNARAGQLAVDTVRSAFMPRVDLQAYGSIGNNSGSTVGESRATGAALALSYNLFKGGASQAAAKQTGFNAAQAQDLQGKACRDVRQTLSVAYSDVRSLSEKMDYEDRHRLASEKTREAYRQQFEIGQRTLLDLLDTQNEYFESARTYTNARHDQAAAQARTLAAMGRLVAAAGVQRADAAEAAADNALTPEERASLNTLCEGAVTEVDTVANIKAGLNLERTPKASGSYVVLLPDRDNKVGKVTVEGKGGKQVLEQAQQGVKADGAGKPYAVSPEQIQRDFGVAMGALPSAPERFVLYFQRGSDQLTPESKALLPKIVERASQRPGLDVSVVGHTDTAGSNRVNEVLGRERATFVTRQLRELGLKTQALEIESYGEKMPQVATPENIREQRNRRVEVILR